LPILKLLVSLLDQWTHRRWEQYKATDVRDFAETIDEIHISGDQGWFVAHWSANNITQPSGERRPIKGYITCVLEKRNGEWKARMHTTFPSRAQ
jgi:ketosteroid isomerase-like protein